MRTNTVKKNRFKTTLILLVVFFILCIAGFALYSFLHTNANIPSQTQLESNPIKNNEQIEKSPENSNATTETVPVAKASTANIDSITQKNGYINLTASINNAESDGECSVIFTNSEARPVNRTASVSKNDSALICTVGNIPESEFSIVGEWGVTLRYFVNGQQVVAQGTIDIK